MTSTKDCIPKDSTVNEARIVPYKIDCFMVSKFTISWFAKKPAIPPANVSPAPVGSLVFLVG